MLQVLFVSFFLICLAYHIYTDMREFLLYDVVSGGLLIVGCTYAYLYGNVWQSLLGALCSGGSMLLMYIFSRGGMGEGDVKLSFVLGVWLGVLPSLVGLALAFSLGGLWAISLLLWRGKKGDEKLPFGPFLCLGGAIALFYGRQIASFYLSYF